MLDNGKIHEVAARKVEVIDMNGAGDAFAGGTLYALSRGYPPEKAAHWGHYLASLVIQRSGARLETEENLSEKFSEILS